MRTNGHAIIAFLLCILCGACGRADEPSKDIPSDEIRAAYQSVQDRLLQLSDGGWIVSRDQNNVIKHQGDSLIWTGLALYALDCEHGTASEDVLLGMMTDLNGGLWRHPSLSDKASMDGALGLYRGISWRIEHCEGSKGKWIAAFSLHDKFSRPSGKLNPNSGAVLPREFTYVRDLLSHRLGLGGDPSNDRLRALEVQIAGWAAAVNAKHAGCFRAHLGYQALKTIQALGGPVSDGGKDAFCAATRGMDLPTVDHYCERSDLKVWIANFTYDQWEFRHQRCGSWETPDGKGYKTPALDLAEALKEAYQL